MAERKIAGREFRVDPPLATDALRLQAKLTRLLEAADASMEDILVAFFGGGEKTQESQAKIVAGAISTVGRVFSKLSPDEYAALVSEIVSMAKIKRPSGAYEIADLDGDFSGNLQAVPELITFVLRVVLSDFFTALLGSTSRLKKAAA